MNPLLTRTSLATNWVLDKAFILFRSPLSWNPSLLTNPACTNLVCLRWDCCSLLAFPWSQAPLSGCRSLYPWEITLLLSAYNPSGLAESIHFTAGNRILCYLQQAVLTLCCAAFRPLQYLSLPASSVLTSVTPQQAHTCPSTTAAHIQPKPNCCVRERAKGSREPGARHGTRVCLAVLLLSEPHSRMVQAEHLRGASDHLPAMYKRQRGNQGDSKWY